MSSPARTRYRFGGFLPTTRVDLGRLGRPLGEKGLGPRTRLAIGPGEGLLFGAGLAAGLTHRPRRRSPSP
jgi:hypothetical protein